MKILVLGIGNILFGDEGIGAHLANLIDEKYEFVSSKHVVNVLDGGTLAQRLIPIITEYDNVLLIDCVNVIDGNIGDVYSFDFNDVPECITWNGSAHEVEMLQTLQMIEMLGDLPPTKIVGVIPYVIGENSTFTMTQEVVKASKTMERVITKYIEDFGVKVLIKKNITLEEVSKYTYLKGTL
ncbi:MAG: hydrogenase expression/formation protein [Sulfurimonas sp. RIFCSPHIGHO2_12_FULL_36_9]|uniref:HyaD/HybD family hydrogenase maturation endopeptidase n=1 Tax=unclassified Sulfurimonas TaxID=2623549 RepID=UPI0008B37C7E|nr:MULTISPECIES: HyaD/HybD family hydrogenase maturation endopeptidase [unclassified Sulfurimonas]MDO9266397.1 HyaD/HybD family hydrogenase maturation endopeptidase [Sulfurimonas sp.]OHD98943.1 MAG: hydrogenase expression/formation protein [Sulfurimonas sp. RIFCSPHIGHO2_12_FULL_36_9]OHE02980.1 MAG: hydrogenase expression/formation protein [Sulfurimonas sp. RIFCSPLOWO2_12_36_12]OHE07229.1 MAG: hydrogenase expression/formation protein [Sulfurimonas sp. RIFCSPLOWO2_12_FULL_36_74]